MMSTTTPEPFDPAQHNVDEVRAYLDGTTDEAERQRVLDAERNGKARSTILDAYTVDAATAEAEQGDDTNTPVFEATAAAQVQPKRYSDPSWAVGKDAPANVVRVYDERGVLGEPREGELQAGERGVVVVREGDRITAGIAAELNR